MKIDQMSLPFENKEDCINKFRHEYKYVCTSTQMAMLHNRLHHLLLLDPHVMKSGSDTASYNIRSMYFDDIDDSCYYENENGTDPREKFRIRIYNHNTDRILLENKRKVRGKTQKNSCPLTKEQCKLLMQGQPLPYDITYPAILQKLLLQMRTRLLKPVVIVDYDRIPYIYQNGNVRITFDKHISSSDYLAGFFDDNMIKRPIMPVNQHILEVKWDEYLPDFIYQSLQIENMQQTTFSKYYLCRRYALHSDYIDGRNKI